MGQSLGTFSLDSNGDLSFTAQAIPEPSSVVLVAIGALILAKAKRKRSELYERLRMHLGIRDSRVGGYPCAWHCTLPTTPDKNFSGMLRNMNVTINSLLSDSNLVTSPHIGGGNPC